MTTPLAVHLRHFSPERLRHYEVACGGDQQRAAELYRWNIDLSSAFMADLGQIEVALRNALDERLIQRHLTKNRAGDWLDDPAGELGRATRPHAKDVQPYSDIATARFRVRRNQVHVTHGQILSETSLGLWHQLVAQRQMFLWPDLAGAFPHAPNRDQATVSDLVRSLRMLRNRIGHHHRIWAQPWQQIHTDLFTLAGYLDPDLADLIRGHSTVITLRPQP